MSKAVKAHTLTRGWCYQTSTRIVLQQAVAVHHWKQLGQAQMFYERYWYSKPQHVNALHLLGAIAHQAGDHGLAVELIGKALKINPRCVDAYCNRGLALQALC